MLYPPPRPCFSGFESSSVSRELETISTCEIVTLRSELWKIINVHVLKVNLSCKLYYKFYRVVACLVPRWGFVLIITSFLLFITRNYADTRVKPFSSRILIYLSYRFVCISARKIAVENDKRFSTVSFVTAIT